jgi:hypothetical protein
MATKPKGKGKGDCYRVAAEMVSYQDKYKDYLCCHGQPRWHGDADGFRFGHAWVEHLEPWGEWSVIDKSNGHDEYMSRDFYYNLGHIDQHDVKRYSRSQVQDFITKLEQWGPWE